MKLAVVSNDQKTIRRDHFGESKYYLVMGASTLTCKIWDQLAACICLMT
jgi:hypothetical protein